MKTTRSLIDDAPKLLSYIDSCLKPKQKEKQEFGEVFTPIPIINDMLDQLDAHFSSLFHKSIFSVSSLTWFDPASGMGNFSVCVFLRLMKGLEGEIVDPEERKQHILEKMLFMSELNTKNVFICKQIFDVNNEHKLNLFHGDTLNELDPKKEWGVEKFDVVMGNPPYNKGGIRSHTGKRLGEKNETIWPMFVEKGMSWLRPEGHMMYINPLSWMKKSHKLHKKMLERHVVWLRIWDNSQSKSEINADIPISLFILQNQTNISKDKTRIESVLRRRHVNLQDQVYLDPKDTIPLAYHSLFQKLKNYIEINNLQLEYKTKTVVGEGKKTKCPEKIEEGEGWGIDTYTRKEGVMVKKMRDRHPDTEKRKLVIANKSSFEGVFIEEGKLGLCGNHKFYITGDELGVILIFLQSKLVSVIAHFVKYGQDFLDQDCFSYIPDIRKLCWGQYDDNTLYTNMGFTHEEIQLIQNHK